LTILFSDPFTGSASDIDDNVVWDAGVGNGATFNKSGGAMGGGAGSDGIYIALGVSFPADQYAEIVFATISGTGGVSSGYGVACRYTSGDYYRLIANGQGWALTRFAAGAFAATIASGSGTTFAATDRLQLELIGTGYSCKKNGVQFASGTDSTLATGGVGVAYSSTETGTVDSYEAGSPGVAQPARLLLLNAG
jgi:hypothetical protein